MNVRTLLLATSSLGLAAPAFAQDAPTPPWAAPAQAATRPDADEGEDGSDIIVTGQKPRGSLVGDRQRRSSAEA